MENLFLTASILFAEGAAGGGGGANGAGDGVMLQMLMLILPIGILFWLLILRPQKREAAKRQDMLNAIKKNDRVVTIGGIYGVVTNLQPEKGKVTIRVDENAKLEMSQSAIARIILDDEADSK